MKKKVVVISLGGSLIVPDKIDVNFLKKFSLLIKRYSKKYKFVIVTGGGSVARKYISAVKGGEPFTSLVGIETTKTNSALVASYFGKFNLIPNSLREVKRNLKKDGIVVCGALGFKPKLTSDGDAAEIAGYLKADVFVNLTNVDGLFDKNPVRYKTAKFISKISFKDFLKIAVRVKFKAGQHFVLDQFAAYFIAKKGIKTVIMNGKKLDNFSNFLSSKKFKGTVIYG